VARSIDVTSSPHCRQTPGTPRNYYRNFSSFVFLSGTTSPTDSSFLLLHQTRPRLASLKPFSFARFHNFAPLVLSFRGHKGSLRHLRYSSYGKKYSQLTGKYSHDLEFRYYVWLTSVKAHDAVFLNFYFSSSGLACSDVNEYFTIVQRPPSIPKTCRLR
jgi:hypothetical protein